MAAIYIDADEFYLDNGNFQCHCVSFVAVVMKPYAQVFPTIAVLLSTAVLLTVFAPAADAADDAAPNPILAPSAQRPSQPQRAPANSARAVSSETAAHLATAAPAYTPPPAPGAPLSVVEEREDKPRNGIIRLPRYIVREPKPPALSEIQILTPKGKAELAMKAFPGLRFGSFGIFNNNQVALEMLEEELALARKRQATDLVTLLPVNPGVDDPATDGKTRRLIQDAVTPRSSWANMTVDRAPGR